jgi:RND superfamily putative drug exporter
MARLIVAHRKSVVLGWLLLAAAMVPLAGRVEGRLDVATRIPGSESAALEEALATRFESPFARSALLVVTGLPSPDTPEGVAALRRVVSSLSGARGVTRTISYLETHDPFYLGSSGRGTYIVVGLDPGDGSVDTLIPGLRAATQGVRASLRAHFPGAELRFTGEGALNGDFRRASTEQARAAEVRALPLTLAMLLLAFGGAAAATLPVVAGALAIVLSLGVVGLLTGFFHLAVTLESVVSMLGLGLGIDYALLTVSRFREFRSAGHDREKAAEGAARYAGRTVALSGASVAIGFLGLLLVPLEELRSVAVGGLIVVAVSVLLATTFLPALLAWLGPRTEMGRIALPRFRRATADTWRRWGSWVGAHPALVLALTGGPILLLAAQALRMNAELPRGNWLPREMESSQAIQDLWAMGRSGIVQELRVLVEFPEEFSALDATGWAATSRLADFLGRDPRVSRVRSLRLFAGERGDDLAYVSLLPYDLKRCFVSAEGNAALLEVIPREGIEPAELSRFAREIRRADPAVVTGLKGVRLEVGGLPGFHADYEDALGGRLVVVVAVVLVATLVALFVGFGSVLIPLKAVLLNLLSVASAFGALVLVFQEGHGGGWLGLSGPAGGVFPAVPILVFTIVFGLSMDYEVFLVARVAEARRAGLDEGPALGEGLARTGGVITSAAAVMVAVFSAFARGDFLLIQMLGFALAVAVLIDAIPIRLAIGPALLSLAGRWNWWPGFALMNRGVRAAEAPTVPNCESSPCPCHEESQATS